MITETEALERLRPILAEILVLNEQDVRREARMVDDLDADSVAFLELNYRLEHDFGLQIPRQKVTEEMLSHPLLEVLDQRGLAGSDPGMLEYMTGEMLFAARQNPEIHTLLMEQFQRSLSSPEFKKDFHAALLRTRDELEVRRDMINLSRAIRQTPALTLLMAETVAADPESAAIWEELRRDVPEEPEQEGAAPELPMFWSVLFRDAPARRCLSEITTDQFARLLGTATPVGIAPEMPMASLCVRDLFRFITVGFFVGYIVFLARKQGGGAPAAPTEFGKA
jgi:acyl carrier protein